MKTLVIVLLASAVTLSTGCAPEKAVASYDECILKNIGGVDSDTAAQLIHQACRSQFPESDTQSQSCVAVSEEKRLEQLATNRFAKYLNYC
ncbi:MAG: hypothetical protein CMQ46_13900 [Gammaproteobacteria bacterium]|mgnify:CR=1 FL=1|nr:hypothetical protein [Gammaproteobacteria bacterium]MBJ56344.1 hypothetical protein [Gammaproteobacteria bacterium]HBN13528.1 hypothetical protein [Pseudohongiella sp.]|tara:strand:+ start:1148 stop:1420 length:273 start_codon:yes stop_codon:yes gene_type:complete